MNIDHLRYFVTTSETMHVAKAANIMHVSQSTVSHAIRKLEEELDIELFENQGKRIVLTEAGSAFSLKARELIDQAEALKNEFRSGTRPLEGVFRFGASHGLSSRSLAPLLGAFQKKNPNMVCEIYSLRSSQVVEGIVGRTLDVGLCYSPTQHPDFIELQSVEIDMHIAVRSNHPLLKAGRVKASEVSQYPNVSPKAFAGIEVCVNHPALEKLGISSEPMMMFDSYEVAGEFLKKSKAWCLMPENLISELGLKALNVGTLKAKSKLALIAPKGRSLPLQLLAALEGVF